MKPSKLSADKLLAEARRIIDARYAEKSKLQQDDVPPGWFCVSDFPEKERSMLSQKIKAGEFESRKFKRFFSSGLRQVTYYKILD